FSIDELDLGASDSSTAGIGELPTSLQPFSLDEPPPQRPRVSGFISPESADNENIADEEDFTPETRGYSWQQAAQKPETSFLKTPREEPSSEASIFAKLKQRHLSNPEDRTPPALPPVSIDADEHLGLFSLDHISLHDDSEHSLPETAPPAAQAESAPAESAASEPPAKPILEIENLEDAVASGQVQPFSLADLGLSEEEIAAIGMGEATSAPVSISTPQKTEGVIIDTIEFDPTGRDYAGEYVLISNPSAASVDLTGWKLRDISGNHSFTFPPFLLAAGESVRLWTRRGVNDAANLYWDSVGAIWNNTGDTAILQNASGTEVNRFSFEPPPSDQTAQPSAQAASEPPAKPTLEIENLEDAVASGQVQPFSLADLGLSEEEIAAMGLGEAPAPDPPAAPPEIENLEDADASGQVQPFSLADLGLSEEEIAAMGLSDTASAATPADEQGEPAAELGEQPDSLTRPLDAIPSQPAQPSAEAPEEGALLTSDLKPFSLTDLGLSDDEISALGLDTSSESDESGGMGLDLTEEELEGLDGGDLNWASQPAQTAAPIPTQPEPQLTTGDLVVDRLIALGRQQGYVDIADIMADFEDPEAEAGRIEEIGQLLHAAETETRDGDKHIDMDADNEEDEPKTAEPTEDWTTVPEMPAPATPTFPRDLDLATDDADQLGLAEAAAPTADTSAELPADEPNMTPFSLSELGLSGDEINALGLDEPAAPAAPSAPPSQPDMTPFSLSELGLSDDEIVALGLGEPAAAVEPPAPAEPDMTPFSLSELGLSDDESAVIDGGQAAASSVPVQS